MSYLKSSGRVSTVRPDRNGAIWAWLPHVASRRFPTREHRCRLSLRRSAGDRIFPRDLHQARPEEMQKIVLNGQIKHL
jgi:hypothetical protein